MSMAQTELLEGLERLVAKGMRIDLSLDEEGRGVCVLIRQSADESPEGLSTHAAHYGPNVESALEHALEQARDGAGVCGCSRRTD